MGDGVVWLSGPMDVEEATRGLAGQAPPAQIPPNLYYPLTQQHSDAGGMDIRCPFWVVLIMAPLLSPHQMI